MRGVLYDSKFYLITRYQVFQDFSHVELGPFSPNPLTMLEINPTNPAVIPTSLDEKS